MNKDNRSLIYFVLGVVSVACIKPLFEVVLGLIQTYAGNKIYDIQLNNRKKTAIVDAEFPEKNQYGDMEVVYMSEDGDFDE